MHTFKAHQTEWRTYKVHSSPDAAFIPHTLGLFSEVATHPPPSWPSSRLLALIADFVCIDTAPQSCTAVRGQRCPAGGQPNDKVNESGLDSDMPPSAITGARRKRTNECRKQRGGGGESEHWEEERRLSDLFYQIFQFLPDKKRDGREKRKMEDKKRGRMRMGRGE